MEIEIYNEDCIIGSPAHIKNETVDLGIYDPPFGINESEFDKHYFRKKDNVIEGYREAPVDYSKFSENWIGEAKRILKPDGSMYIISGWTHLNKILNVVEHHGLYVINHLIWKFNFGVSTSKKFVSSHYHVLYIKKERKSNTTFNTHCRFSPDEKEFNGGSSLYKDLEDVFVINKDFSHGELKNQNKLPDELIQKLILYSSNENNTVCDFFMGNFTTARIALGLKRNVCGFELNKNSYDYWMPKLKQIEFGSLLKGLKQVNLVLPKNQGKPISEEERNSMISDFIDRVHNKHMTKKASMEFLMEKYGRGKFSIIKVLDGVDIKINTSAKENKFIA